VIVRCSGEPRFIDERVASLEHGEMQLRHSHVRIVARVADMYDALCVSLEVCSVQTKQGTSLGRHAGRGTDGRSVVSVRRCIAVSLTRRRFHRL
jgi:hypothetical protein